MAELVFPLIVMEQEMDIFQDFDRNFKVLVADDAPQNLLLIQKILRSPRCQILTASDGKEALEKVIAESPDLVLLDVMMPEIDGFEVCRSIKQHEQLQLIPVIMITGLQEPEAKIHGLESGADDFINKPFSIAELVARIRSSLRLKSITDELEHAESVLFSMALGVEAKDPTTNGHCERLSLYSQKLGHRLGLSPGELKALKRGGILHDIGKLGIPDAILLSPNTLSSEEWDVMRQHTLIGERICQPLRSFREVLPIIRSHHERWDGGGYPDSLRKDEIPITARILQTVDVFDALCSERPYKPSFGMRVVHETMREEAQKGWRDHELLYEFFKLVESQEVDELLESYQTRPSPTGKEPTHQGKPAGS
jgi:putative two-component system response regulator